jgi:hypothetical protein
MKKWIVALQKTKPHSNLLLQSSGSNPEKKGTRFFQKCDNKKPLNTGEKENKEATCVSCNIKTRSKKKMVAIEKHRVLQILSGCLQPQLASRQSACAVVL